MNTTTYRLLAIVAGLLTLFCAIMCPVCSFYGNYLDAFTYGTCALLSIPMLWLFDAKYDYVD